MNALIGLSTQQQQDLWRHLLPEPLGSEQAAFIFADVFWNEECMVLTAREIYLSRKEDFEFQQSDYLELTNEARIAVIKKAYATETSIIEVHSHPFPGQWAAAFSLADISGLSETVPHMWWRLNKRPYAALVVAPNGFDALVWHEGPEIARQVTGLLVDGKIIKSSNRTMGVFHDRHFGKI